MPVPATTGQLRTKVSDMQIGDYLSAAYSGATANGLGAVRADISFGDATNPNYGFPEIPITGLTGAAGSTTGYFYFVKAEKGILIADRVVHNSISWDNMNTGKVIQGLPWDGNIIPTMTSYTAPSGVASASSEQSSGSYPAWKAFDHSIDANGANCWLSATPSGWLAYDLGVGVTKTVTTYYISARIGGGAAVAPKNWTFEGSNDNSVWTILDTRMGESNWPNDSSTLEKRKYYFTNKTAYRYYRINITANNGGTYIAVGELEMFEIAGIIRSLTGGVAYADANGNSSTTDASKGAWPQNNEWDKYIVNSDLSGKITKDNNNVWHHDYSGSGAPFTWCQNTPALSLGAAANRVRRARNSGAPYVANNPSSAVLTYIGFRPVFEYKEV